MEPDYAYTVELEGGDEAVITPDGVSIIRVTGMVFHTNLVPSVVFPGKKLLTEEDITHLLLSANEGMELTREEVIALLERHLSDCQ